MAVQHRNKLRIGITPGDPNGIGYEILLKIFSDSRVLDLFIPVIYGSKAVFEYYAGKLAHMFSPVFPFYIDNVDKCNPKRVNFVNVWTDDFSVDPGTPSKDAGLISVISLKRIVEDCKRGGLDAIVTGPIDKNSTKSEKFPYVGHTEFFAAQQFNTTQEENKASLMFMVSENIKVGLVTMHKALAEVPSAITIDSIVSHIDLLYSSLVRDFGSTNPKIAVLSLNPHSGDNGVIGSEEKDIIIPAIAQAESKGLIVAGPFSSDGFFGSGAYKKFDAVLAMYHDQGLIPFKSIAVSGGVNYTAGLPIVRTSPAHGVGYDIAGVGAADPSSFRYAIYTAIDIVRNRRIFEEITSNQLKYIRKHSGDKIQKEQNVDELLPETNIED